jgi:hypothetical protein
MYIEVNQTSGKLDVIVGNVAEKGIVVMGHQSTLRVSLLVVHDELQARILLTPALEDCISLFDSIALANTIH